MERIYADYAATAPLAEGVAEAMAPWLGTQFGNPSSLHEEGRRAKMAIDEAREVISERMGCLFAEVIFTSGGTEAATLAIVGSALNGKNSSRTRILLGAAEHHCVLGTEKILRMLGYQVDLIPVDRHAVLDVGWLEDQAGPDVLLVSAMLANNEVGSLQPVSEVARITRRYGIVFHCDAVQGFGVLPLQVDTIGADLIGVSAHKIGGPKGVGALYVRAGTRLEPIIVGGGQERELRAGTENVAGIVGFAEAVRRAEPEEATYPAAAAFREAVRGESELTLSPSVPCLPGIVHLRFSGIEAETLLIRLDRMGVSASAGAACSSGSLEPSHVLIACGYRPDQAREGVRFSFGQDQSASVGAECARRVFEAVKAIRSV